MRESLSHVDVVGVESLEGVTDVFSLASTQDQRGTKTKSRGSNTGNLYSTFLEPALN
jgi:hypothetical protein